MGKFKPGVSDPDFLLPTRVGDLIPQDDLSWVVLEVVNRLDLRHLTAKYSYRGREGFHPELLLKLIFFGVAIGARSSRKLARLAVYDVRAIMLCGGLHPSWRTISRFMKDNRNEVKGLFRQVLRICIELGMVGFGHLSLDGTKVPAAASKKKNRTPESLEKELERLTGEFSEALSQIEKNDQDEDDDELPPDLRDKEKRIGKIREALDKLEEQEEKEGSDSRTNPRYNMTDPDSRLMRTNRNGYQQSYNHQITVDDRDLVITAYTTSRDASDIHQMRPAVEASQSNTGLAHQALLADTGYFSGENLTYLAEKEIDGYICPERETGEYRKSRFLYDPARDVYVCPHGRELRNFESNGGGQRRYIGNCSGCPHQCHCVRSKSGNRQIERDPRDPLREAMRAKLLTEQGQQVYRRRKEVVEPVFGQVKTQSRFEQHLQRGAEGADSEWGLVCLVHNLKRIWHRFRNQTDMCRALQPLTLRGSV